MLNDEMVNAWCGGWVMDEGPDGSESDRFASPWCSFLVAAFIAGVFGVSIAASRPRGYLVDPLEVIGDVIRAGFGFAVLGAITGAMVADTARFRRAVVCGVILFASAASIAMLAWEGMGTIPERIWLVAAVGAVGGLCGGAGTVVSRRFGPDGRPGRLRFSLAELLTVFLLLAFVFGYLGHLMR